LAPSCATGSTRSPPTTAMTGPSATGRAGPRLAGRAGPAPGVAGDRHRLRGGHRRPGAADRPDRRRAAPARQAAPPRVKVLRTLPGVGEFTALVMLAEIGDISRFASARKLASCAGLTPTVRGSDLTVRHGHISKQGSAWLRWVSNQAAQTAKRGRIKKNSPVQPGGARSHRARFVRPLDTGGPYGCRDEGRRLRQ